MKGGRRLRAAKGIRKEYPITDEVYPPQARSQPMSQPLVLPEIVTSMLASFRPVFTRPA